jgi:xanthine dehydrogenase accessory factor
MDFNTMNEIRALLETFDAAHARGERCAMATVVSVEGSAYRQPGARMLVCESGSNTGTISAGCLEADVIEHARRVIATGVAKVVEYNNTSANDETAWGLGLSCNGVVRLFVEPLTATSSHIEALRRSRFEPVVVEHANGFNETILPPVPLIVFGAGPDVLPVIELARRIGWQTEVVDPQARAASRMRFAVADKVTLARPDEVATHVSVTARTMALLMSHNYAQDIALLRFLLDSPARYIGVMGPRHRAVRMLHELETRDIDATRIHAPVGLDIGANGPAEIALSIVGEMRAVLERRTGGMLRDQSGTIHDRVTASNVPPAAVASVPRETELLARRI